jgi:hypothetical protein
VPGRQALSEGFDHLRPRIASIFPAQSFEVRISTKVLGTKPIEGIANAPIHRPQDKKRSAQACNLHAMN